uniref:Uncharacterized protein n=1 Tax=Ditylenchus dipsaci TaxID=166011 RepID=A0A915DNQ4_9BILA
MAKVDKKHTITHIIFDFDGVLIDSERQYSVANTKCLALFGRIFTMGRKKAESVEVLLKMNGLNGSVTVNDYMRRYDLMLEEFIPQAVELPGASKLINHFHAHNLPLAICTGSDTEEFALKMRNYSHWLDKIPFKQVVLSGSDPEVKNGKPHPDPYLVTLTRFPVPPASPKSVLVFEDSVNGARSAITAGLTVIMVPQKEFLPANWEEVRQELEPQLAEILESLEEFVPEKYGLPAFC